MELALNLAWTVLTMAMLWLWLRGGARKGISRWMQLAALVTVILILLPAISVTDDLMMAQSPAEAERCQRKDHVCPEARGAVRAVADVTSQFSIVPSALCIASSQFSAPGDLLAAELRLPAIKSIQNRPPPAA